MPRFLLDTGCMVALLCSWHEHHERAVREVERRLDDGGILVVAAPTLVETYAVLTRLPPPRRLSPADSRTLLDVNFLSAGRQMPGHFCRADLRIITTSSVIATQIPHAAGAALASKIRVGDDVVITYFGDGATSEGDFHEGLNFAAIHKVAAIFVCENNGYAISVPLSKQSAVQDLAIRASSYGMPGVIVDGNDVVAVYRATLEAVERADRGEGPTLIEAKTYRTGPHTSDDDDRGYRPREEVDEWRRERDPIMLFERRLREAGIMTDDMKRDLEERIGGQIEAAITAAERAPYPDASEILHNVYAPGTPLGS